LERTVTDAGIGGRFHFAPMDPNHAKVSSSVYYRELAQSAYLLALLPPNHAGYRTFKITSVVPASIGFRVPVILDRPSAKVYGIPCISHRTGDLASGIIRALSLDNHAYGRLRSELEQRRESALADARSETARLLRTVRGEDNRRRSPLTSVRASLGSLVAKGGRTRRTGSTADRDDRAAFLDFVRHALRHSYAQRFQDLWALWECGLAGNGYFVEFGAQHGLYGSNTYLLEQLGWEGVVAEPHPDFGDELRHARRCAISTKCVYDRSGETVRFQAVKGRPALSTIEGFGDDLRRDLRSDYTVHDVETISLNDLLTESSAPREIQFLSVDTEGSELRILRAYDFSRHDIACICVEHNYHQRDDLLELLTKHGFRRKWPTLSGQDDWYVNDAVIREWDPDSIPTALSRIRSVAPASKTY
jgi:FkbM family methyltransferase